MSGFIQGQARNQSALFPEYLDDFVAEESAVRLIDLFIDELNLVGLGFNTVPNSKGRPGYHPAVMLKLFIYGYFNRVLSSRRLEREAQRNIELMWLVGRLAPDFKTIADFRKNMVKLFAWCVVSSSCCARSLISSKMHSLRLTVVSSKQSIIGIGTLLVPR
jgi:transposase